MIDRPTFNYDNSGNALVPAAPAPTEVISEIATQDQPSPKTSKALAPATAQPPAVTSVRDSDGRIIRPDWSLPTTEVKANQISKLPDWSEKPRNAQGQFVTKSQGELIEQWHKQGGYAQNVARVERAEQTMFALSEDPPKLAAAINELPRDVALKAAEHLALSSAPGKGWLKFDQFLNALTESEFETVLAWSKKLSKSDRDAIFEAFIR
jgi:hypothetical protein